MMKLESQEIEGVILLKRSPFKDERGSFSRLYCREELGRDGIQAGIDQINLSANIAKNTLRGFHLQRAPKGEQKILTVIKGAIYNVVIDLRERSSTRFKWWGIELSEASDTGLFVPLGCANAFFTLKPDTHVLYFMNGNYDVNAGIGIRYNDPFFNVKWPGEPIVISERDRSFPDFDPTKISIGY